MERVTRATLKKVMEDSGIEPPETATLTQLKSLYTSIQSSLSQATGAVENADAAQKTADAAQKTAVDAADDAIDKDAENDADDGAVSNTDDNQDDNAGNASDADDDAILSSLNVAADNAEVGRNLTTRDDLKTYSDAAAKLNAEIELLQKRLEIKRLQKQLADLEVTVPCRNDATSTNLADMESALPTFSGDDPAVSIRDFLRDFESVLALCANAERNKLLWLRRSLTGTAKLFLATTSSLNYDELREALVKEFGTYARRHDVYQKLANRHWKAGEESLHAYILTMQAIAKQSHVDDAETLQFILEGLENKVGHLELLMSANSIEQLKKLVERYQGSKLMLPKRTPAPKTQTQPMTRGRTTQNTAAKTAPPREDADPLCYNCSRRGHIKPNCPFPLRPNDSCFKCWKVGHNYRNCPNPRMELKPVRGAYAVRDYDDVDDNCDGDDSCNPVSVAFKVGSKRGVVTKEFFSLFDTGSPHSFIRSDVMPTGCSVADANKIIVGVGGGKAKVRSAVYCSVKFKCKEYAVKLYVLGPNVMNMPLILGRDFLNKSGIKLIKTKLMYSREQLISLKSQLMKCTSFGPTTQKILQRFNLGSNCLSCRNVKNTDVKAFEVDINNGDTTPGSNNEPMLPDIYLINTDVHDDLLHIDDKLTITERNQLKEIISQAYVHSSYKNCEPMPYKMKIHLTSDVPFHSVPRRLSYAERDNVAKIIKDLEKDGIVRPSNSPYASAIVLVKKKNGQTRLCVDYRNLNKITVRDNFPLPLIEDCIDYLEGKSIFSVLDLKNGFHQVEISEESVPYTSFVTPTGQYEYLRMPFGLKNAPAVFQRFINKIFEDLINARKLIIYLDDIVIASANIAEHFETLKQVLERVSLRGLQLNLAKCKFGFKEIEYLGYCVSAKGIRLSDAHVSAIKKYPLPSNYKQVHSCIGLFSYFRRFVPNFSRIAKPLLNLLKKDVPFNFDEICVDAFQELKTKLISAPVLSIFNPSKETQLHCDASSSGFGAVLLQRQEDGKLHPTAYFSKTTTAAESRYHSFELETLAIIYALRRFRIYVEGIPLTIVTDCNSLATTLMRKQVNARIARWALELENYNYKVVHRGGNRMPHVDALSRCQISAIIDVGETDHQIQIAQELDSEIRLIKNKLEIGTAVPGFCLVDGLLCKKNSAGRNLLYVPDDMQDNVIRTVHEKLCHLATDKTCEEILRLYWFPKLRTKVTKFIQSCLKCIMYSSPLGLRERNLYNIPKTPIPFDTIHIDHFGPLPSLKSKRKHILVVIDSFTKFVKLYATNSTSTRETIASLNKYFSYYSRPRRIVSDRGTCFTSNEFSEFVMKNNIQHILNAVSAPQANGQVERVNRSLKSMLSKLSDPIDHSDWTRKLEEIEYAMNNSVHKSTKAAPSMLLFGTLQRGKIIDEFSEYIEDVLNDTAERDLAKMRQTAATNIETLQSYNERYFLKHSRPAKNYHVGDVVVIRNVDTTVGQNKKLNATYKGPYIVHKSLGNDRYVVRDLPNFQLTQLPYDGVIEANRLRKWLLPNAEIEPLPQ